MIYTNDYEIPETLTINSYVVFGTLKINIPELKEIWSNRVIQCKPNQTI